MSVYIPKLAAGFETLLNTSVSVGDTTATLLSATDEDGVVLASGTYAFTIDNDTDAKEYIVCSLADTALTSISHISRQGAATSGFSNYHRRGATVQITDWAVLYRLVANVSGATGLDSSSPIFYDGTATISGATMLATKAYVDSVVAGGTVSFDQQVASGQTSGEALTSRDAVYFKEADAKWYKTDADATATSTGVRFGIALATVGSNATVQIAISGPVSGLSGLTAGSKYYVSSTAGSITATAPTAPATESFIGWALSTTVLLLNTVPSFNQFAGTSGTPSSTNKFVTALGTSDGTADQSQTTQNGTFSAGEANATTRHNKLAQSFIPTKNQIKSVSLYKSANTGTFTGTVTISLQADTAGSPSGVALATKTITNALYNTYAVGEYLALFTAETAVTPGNLYWIVIETSTSDTSNCINLGTNTAGGYANGSSKYNNTTDGWVAIATIDLYFKVNQGFSAKDIAGTSTGFVPTQASLLKTKVGTTALANGATTTIAHGLGKIPALIRASFYSGNSGQVSISSGVYDFVNNAYAENWAIYNEATAGANGPSTSRLVGVNPNTAVLQTDITISAYDENVITFSNGAGTSSIQYEIIA